MAFTGENNNNFITQIFLYRQNIFHCHFTESVLSLSDESYDLGVIDRSREVFSGLGAKLSGTL